MRIIPVLDLMKGRVVQGIRGERERYRPVQSVLTPGSAPLEVARALQHETGCREFYVADLDAIQGCGSHEDAIRALVDALGVDLWVDASITDAASAVRTLKDGAGRVVVGSETLPSLESLRAIRDAVPPGRVLFSLDVGTGGVLSRAPALQALEPLDALDLLSREGLTRVILLTLNRVGTGGGPDWSLLKTARSTFSHLSLFAGGGVRSPEDVRKLAELGVTGALIATSLHRGWITGESLREIVGAR